MQTKKNQLFFEINQQAFTELLTFVDFADNKLNIGFVEGELEILTNRVANGLKDLGFTLGDRVAIAMPMTAESVAIYLGIIKAGSVVVAIAVLSPRSQFPHLDRSYPISIAVLLPRSLIIGEPDFIILYVKEFRR